MIHNPVAVKRGVLAVSLRSTIDFHAAFRSPCAASCNAHSPADRNGGGLPNVQMWQHETFIHFGYITVDIIGCVDGKYEHNSADATCQDFAKIPLRSLLSLSLLPIYTSSFLPSRTASTIVSFSRSTHFSLLSLSLFLPLSNVMLSDDVISYRVLYISQCISGGRLRFA